MIKRFLAWLKSIYFKPAAAEIKTPEVVTMSEPLVGTAVEVVGNATPDTGSAGQSPTIEVKAGVADFEAALSFVESGVSQLGETAKDELKALAKKYL